MAHVNDLFTVPSGATAKVRIIDTTTRLKGCPVSFLMGPPMEGFEQMPSIPAWSFLIETSSGQKALFDLGVPKKWDDFAPYLLERVKGFGWDIVVEKDVDEVLSENGIGLEGVGSVIWSHWHWDHIGDPARWPASTDLVVGPGFKSAFVPAYPMKEKSPLRESYWQGRNLREIGADQFTIKMGQLKAFDFFGDGSFYLLDTPGHAVGHLGGLARTTSNPDTFIFMGGDLCHHGGEIRPSKHLPLPAEVGPNPLAKLGRRACPGSMFESLHSSRSRSPTGPFFEPTIGDDIPLAIDTIEKTQDADVNENILFLFAHDDTAIGVVDFFPEYANDWKEKGWQDKMRWAFLKDFNGALGRANL